MNHNIKQKALQPLNGKLQRRLLVNRNIRCARKTWEVSRDQVAALRDLTTELQLSITAGHLKLIDSNWYVTHAGLLRIAQRNRCSGMRTAVDKGLSDPASSRWVFRATVYKSPRSRGFVGYGDADPSNVSSLVRSAEMRVAETRAVNRALRKAYGIGLCSVESFIGTATDPASAGVSHIRIARKRAMSGGGIFSSSAFMEALYRNFRGGQQPRASYAFPAHDATNLHSELPTNRTLHCLPSSAMDNFRFVRYSFLNPSLVG